MNLGSGQSGIAIEIFKMKSGPSIHVVNMIVCLHNNTIFIACGKFNLFIFHYSEFISIKVIFFTRMIFLLITFSTAGFCHLADKSANDTAAPFFQADPPYECP